MPSVANGAPLQVTAVDVVGLTVSDMDRALAFYTDVLPFSKVSDVELSGRQYELLSGVFGARTRVVRLRLGTEEIELTEYSVAEGPADARRPSRQRPAVPAHRDRRERHREGLRRASGCIRSSTRRPDRSAFLTGTRMREESARSISAIPDRHFLEIISFPGDKGSPKWHQATKDVFLGIDHTAIVVDDTNTSLRFYRDTLGMHVAGESENYDVEQEHLNNVFGARLRITALRAAQGPGIELLEYLAPRDGRPAPGDLRANDVAHWQTTLITERLDPLLGLARDHRITLVSPGSVDAAPLSLGFRTGALDARPRRPRDAVGRSVTRRRSVTPLMRLQW